MIELIGRYRMIDDGAAATVGKFSDFWNGRPDLVEALQWGERA